MPPTWQAHVGCLLPKKSGCPQKLTHFNSCKLRAFRGISGHFGAFRGNFGALLGHATKDLVQRKYEIQVKMREKENQNRAPDVSRGAFLPNTLENTVLLYTTQALITFKPTI